MRAPWMAPADPFGAHPAAFQWSPFLNGFNGILGAGGYMAAILSKQGGNGQLVKANGCNECIR